MKIGKGKINHTLFDFDGILSLIREGWQNIMRIMMVELLLEMPGHESEFKSVRFATNFIEQSTGNQTIFQMIGLAEAITKRGGKSLDPLEYK